MEPRELDFAVEQARAAARGAALGLPISVHHRPNLCGDRHGSYAAALPAREGGVSLPAQMQYGTRAAAWSLLFRAS